MKIYISVDMEGISGINHTDYTRRDVGRLYQEGRMLTTQDVNAAVRGAFDGGADEVIVADMHGMSNNIIVAQVDPRALLVEGAPRTPRFAFLDEQVDGMFLLGYHAMNGTLGGTLEHTMNGFSWHRHAVNGQTWGELGIDATIAAECGVPVVMVSGDDKLCDEARAFLGDQVEAACVKQGVGRFYTLCLSPARGQQVVYEHAKRAAERLKAGEKFPLMRQAAQYTVSICYKNTPEADSAALEYGARRIDGYTVERDFKRIADMYGGIWAEFDTAQRVR